MNGLVSLHHLLFRSQLISPDMMTQRYEHGLIIPVQYMSLGECHKEIILPYTQLIESILPHALDINLCINSQQAWLYPIPYTAAKIQE